MCAGDLSCGRRPSTLQVRGVTVTGGIEDSDEETDPNGGLAELFAAEYNCDSRGAANSVVNSLIASNFLAEGNWDFEGNTPPLVSYCCVKQSNDERNVDRAPAPPPTSNETASIGQAESKDVGNAVVDDTDSKHPAASPSRPLHDTSPYKSSEDSLDAMETLNPQPNFEARRTPLSFQEDSHRSGSLNGRRNFSNFFLQSFMCVSFANAELLVLRSQRITLLHTIISIEYRSADPVFYKHSAEEQNLDTFFATLQAEPENMEQQQKEARPTMSTPVFNVSLFCFAQVKPDSNRALKRHWIKAKCRSIPW